jgi:hypothetical protein
MGLFEDPIKGKKVFNVTLIVAIIFFIGCGVLGFLYWNECHKLTDMQKDKDSQISSKDKTIAELNSQISDLNTTSEGSLAELTKSNKTLTDQATANKAKVAKALKYNDFFKYLTSVINTHQGFTGWTTAEFQVGKSKAEATGDASFVSTVNWAWYDTNTPSTTRVIRTWNEIADGISNALK